MKKSIAFALMAAGFLLMSFSARAQEWTSEQKEVWKVTEDIWIKMKNGDLEALAANIHEKYQGWGADAPLPYSREKMLEWYAQMKEMATVNYMDLNPARIAVTASGAVVDYYFSLSMTYKIGDATKTEEIRGKNAEFYVKENGKWLLLGDMTVYQDKED